MSIPRTVIGYSLIVVVLSGAIAVFVLRHAPSQGVGVPTNQTTPASAPPPPAESRESRSGNEPDSELVKMREKLDRAELELINVRTERKALEESACEKEERIAQLEREIRVTKAEPSPVVVVNTPEIDELKAQLQEAKQQIDVSEQEKRLLAEKVRMAQERNAKPKPKSRGLAGGYPGIRGRVLAVNRSYNFVVLDMGARQGVEANSEMLVIRGDTFIGKIRVSSVEPVTTIGDIITTSLARGVRVQQGDIVIYAGTNF